MTAFVATVRAAFHDPTTTVYRYVQGLVWLLITVSVTILLVDFYLGASYPGKDLVNRVDGAILWFFAAEITLRILSFRPPSLDFFKQSPTSKLRHHVVDRLAYCLRPMSLIDILTVAALVPALRGLRALRLLRLLRTLKFFRYSNPFQFLARSFRENTLLFGLSFMFLFVAVSLGGVSIYLIEGRNHPKLDSGWDGIWWALVTLTTVGYGEITPITGLGRVIGGFLMIAGMFTLALFAGVVGHTLVKSLLPIREEQFRMSGYYQHVVVCGYEAGAEMLLKSLLQEVDPETRSLVVFAEGDRPADLTPEFVWVSGDPTKESELEKGRISHASAVIVVGSRRALPQDADARTILTTFTLRSYLDRVGKGRNRPLYIVAEILDEENVAHAFSAGADEVIETRRLGFSLLTHAVSMPGTASVMSKVVTVGANSVFIGDVPERFGASSTFEEVARSLKEKEGVLLIGVQAKSGQHSLNPKDSLKLAKGTRLVYLAETAVLGGTVVV